MKFEGTDFYAALIHELKNNLGVLTMTLERIPLQGEAEHDAAVVAARQVCEGAIDRLHQALLVYKAGNQQIRSSIDAYSPHDLVRQIEARACALARGRFRIEVAIAEALPALWFFDRNLIEMALINAIHNALAYARSNIRIEAGVEAGRLVLRVRDDSPGYPEHILASLADGGTCPAKGTGLGLQFARLIAQSHHNQGHLGELRLYNDSGAVFCLILP